MAKAPDFQLEGLTELRAALKEAGPKLTRELSLELRQAAKEVQDEARDKAPVRSGNLRKGYKAYAKGSKRRVEFGVRNRKPYAAGAEFGQRGKWKGFQKYGPRGNRILFASYDEAKAMQIADDVFDRLARVANARGWLNG